jgi:hypothetical protein
MMATGTGSSLSFRMVRCRFPAWPYRTAGLQALVKIGGYHLMNYFVFDRKGKRLAGGRLRLGRAGRPGFGWNPAERWRVVGLRLERG